MELLILSSFALLITLINILINPINRRIKNIDIPVLLSNRIAYDIPSTISMKQSSIIKSYAYDDQKIKTSERNKGLMYDDGLSAYNIKKDNIIFWRDVRYYFDFKEHIGDFFIISPSAIDINPFRSDILFQGNYIGKLVDVFDSVDDLEIDNKCLKETIDSVLNNWRLGDFAFGATENSYELSIKQQYKEVKERYPEESQFAILYTRELCKPGTFSVRPISEIIGLVEYVQR